ncbi:MAG: alpha-glucosidase [Anaerolineales bacterium]|nr:alpha-glucosidase [Anaerolineales bacterium]
MKTAWWKECVVYQIYPRSFADSNGDGIGDLRGIIGKLDYLKTLGVDVIWLSPVYKSPNDDNGYDISDYQDIMTEFGTLADWDELVVGMHARGLRLVMDLVVNHSSDEHPWFVESRKSKDNPYRDYYIWRPGKDGGTPNNWKSFFTGSAWKHDPATDEYFLHLFSTKQPDLNWENPRVRREVFDMMHWWLKRGVDGFRMDVINMLSKVPGLPDAEPVDGKRHVQGSEHFICGPRLTEFLGEMKRDVLSQYDILTVGETPMVSPDDAVALTDEKDGALNMVFQFEHMDVDRVGERLTDRPNGLRDLKQVMTRWQKGLEGRAWNSNYLSNHDQPRQVSRYGDDGAYRVVSAKLLATFNHLLQGTPYVYQGEEIGMTNVAFDTIADYRDIAALNMYRVQTQELGQDPQVVLGWLHAKSRDNARTPMQWSAGPQAGFSTAEPWIKINPNYTTVNVEQALADPDSVFCYYQKLIQLRKANPIFVYGTYDLILPEHDEIYAFTRTLDGERLLVVLNFTAKTPEFAAPTDLVYASAELVIGNYPAEAGDVNRFTLRPYEARVYRLTA